MTDKSNRLKPIITISLLCRITIINGLTNLFVLRTFLALGDIPMIECSGTHCSGPWFHLICKYLEEHEIPEDDWFCSRVCKRLHQAGYQYCICRTDKGNTVPMALCDNDHCKRGQWFHLTCVAFLEKESPGH